MGISIKWIYSRFSGYKFIIKYYDNINKKYVSNYNINVNKCYVAIDIFGIKE